MPKQRYTGGFYANLRYNSSRHTDSYLHGIIPFSVKRSTRKQNANMAKSSTLTTGTNNANAIIKWKNKFSYARSPGGIKQIVNEADGEVDLQMPRELNAPGKHPGRRIHVRNRKDGEKRVVLVLYRIEIAGLERKRANPSCITS